MTEAGSSRADRPTGDPERWQREERRRVQGLAVGLGPMFVAGLALGYFGGAWLDRRFGTAPWGMVSGLGLGALVGFREVWRIVGRLQALERSRSEDTARRRREALGAGPSARSARPNGDGSEGAGS